MDHHVQSVKALSEGERSYSAIGRFIVEFSQLENELKMHVAGAIGLKDEHMMDFWLPPSVVISERNNKLILDLSPWLLM